MPIKVTLQNGVEAKRFLANVERAIRDQQPVMFRSMGDVLVDDVQRRIITRNGGKWAPASKWAKAKTGYEFPTLLGAEKYVKARVTSKALKIVSTARGWSLTQHHDGFVNKLADPKEERDEYGRVVLRIKDGRPLNLYVEMRRKRDGTQTPRAQRFAFRPKKPGVTPARQIWPREDQAIKLVEPIASRWLAQIIAREGGSIVRG